MLRTLIGATILCALAASTHVDIMAASDEHLFALFQRKYQRLYSAEEATQRFEYFQENMKRARHLIMEARARGDPVVYGITPFSDYSEADMKPLAHGSPATMNAPVRVQDPACSMSCDPASIPRTFDWRNDPRPIVSSVGSQGTCGACWAFATSESVQAAWALANNTFISKLSVEQLLLCMQSGCGGGSVEAAMEYVQNAPGLMTETNCPYTCQNGCTMTGCPSLTTPLAYINGASGCGGANETTLMCTLRTVGPFAIRVDARTWNLYVSGIIRHNCATGGEYGDHSVQVVGYGDDTSTDPPTPFWLVKNSWSTSFGEGGYLRIARGSNLCGIANDVRWATSAHQ